MLSILSPAKSLNYACLAPTSIHTTPHFLAQTGQLLAICKKLTASKLQDLMGISEKLAELNWSRFQDFGSLAKKQAIFAYDGDVYDNIERDHLSEQKLNFMQDHLLIISGLYGLLRPLDYIQAYRLEMSIKLPELKMSLYDFWSRHLTDYINEELKNHKHQYLINLASNEYSSAIDFAAINSKKIDIHFKENRAGKLQTIGINAKKARGMMANFIIQNLIDEPAPLKDFTARGYKFAKEHSEESSWVFVSR